MALCNWRVGSCMRNSILRRNVHLSMLVDAGGLRASRLHPTFTEGEGADEHAPRAASRHFGKTKPPGRKRQNKTSVSATPRDGIIIIIANTYLNTTALTRP